MSLTPPPPAAHLLIEAVGLLFAGLHDVIEGRGEGQAGLLQVVVQTDADGHLLLTGHADHVVSGALGPHTRGIDGRPVACNRQSAQG